MKGKFIIVEGLDLAGKSTIIRKIEKVLQDVGKDVFVTHLPSGCLIGSAIINVVKNNVGLVSPEELCYIMTGVRMNHNRTVIEPKLNDGTTVISDRSIVSTFVYNVSDNPITEELLSNLTTQDNIIKPDLYIYVRSDKETFLKRLQAKTERDGLDNEVSESFDKKHGLYERIFNEIPDNRKLAIDNFNITEEELDHLIQGEIKERLLALFN